MSLKYGVIVTTPKKGAREKFINIGDDIQAIAVRNLYYEMEISDKDILYIDFNDLNDYDGEYVILPICFNLQTDYNLIPFPRKIIPVFIGLSLFETSRLKKEVIEYLKRYEPIGLQGGADFFHAD